MDIILEKLKYPIGKFAEPENITAVHLKEWIRIIDEFPDKLIHEVQGLTEDEQEKQYRPGGWTIKQVVHHCADSHMNSFIRFKLTLTEETPTVKPYFENLWAGLPDSKTHPIGDSLLLLKGLHGRWATLLKNLSGDQLDKEFFHPESGQKNSLKSCLAMYAWHCEHHLAHVKMAVRAE